MAELTHVIKHSVTITVFVFVMMLLVDYINVMTRGRLSTMLKGGFRRQYTVSSFLGATPGCLGAFINVSFYVRGLLSFGAIVGGMIATSGDGAFVMLTLFPKTAFLLFGLLFLLGIIFGWLTDRLAPLLKIAPCQECRLAPLHLDDEACRCFAPSLWLKFPHILLSRFLLLGLMASFLIAIGFGFLGPAEWGWEKISLFLLLPISMFIIATVPEHYLKEHVMSHIVKEHIWRVFLWALLALLIIHFGLEHWNLSQFVQSHMVGVLLISALVGLIPESGPHLIFITMFAQGLVPFSVLLTSSFVQDGHGMLPLLSYSVKDSVRIKLFNFIFGLLIGGIIYLIGF